MAIYTGGNSADNLSGTSLADQITGQDGNDSLQGLAGDDSIDGGAGNDVLSGGDGNDTLSGGTGIDLMSGGLGSDSFYVDNEWDRVVESGTQQDTVYAASSFMLESLVENLILTGGANLYGLASGDANSITGNTGNNVLDGGAGNDSLYGNDGDDVLKGGAGADRLEGGNGNDTYRWKTAAESAGTAIDTIHGFAAGEKLDVSAFDANTTVAGRQAFTFIGTASGFTAAGQLRLFGGVLYGNTDGNLATAEFQVNLNGVTSLTSGNFIFTDTSGPAWLSSTTAGITENAGSGKIVYKSVVDDGVVTFALQAGGDAARFAINASTGNVTLLDNPNEEVKGSYTFTIVATDQSGNVATRTVNLTVADVDEVAPSVTSAAIASAPENASLVYQASADDSADISAGVKWSVTGADAALLAIDATTGVVTLASGVLDYEGSKTSYSFNVVASDGVTAGTAKAVTVSVTNVNEAPTDLSLSASAIDENTSGLKVGDVTVTDPDASGNSNVLTVSDTVNFEIRNGTELWFIGAAPDREATAGYSVTITSTDGTLTYSEPFTVTVTDVNETPDLRAGPADDDAESRTEGNSGLSASGTLTVSDVDAGGSVVVSVLSVAKTGVTAGLVPTDADLKAMMGTTPDPIDGDSGADGNVAWTWDSGSEAFDYLGDGETLTLQYTLSANDGGLSDDHVVTIVVTGTNDPASITGTAMGSVTEKSGAANGTPGVAAASGDLDATDVDGSSAFVVQSAEAQSYGTFSIDTTGAWTYTLDDANTSVQALNTSGTLTETVVVATADGTTQVVTITINGANDKSTVTGTATGSVTESSGIANGTPGTASASGDLDAVDPDDGPASFIAQVGSLQTYGSFSIDTTGAWTYTINEAAVQSLAGGASAIDNMTVTTSDGAFRVILITVYGADDYGTVSGTSTGSVTEAGAASPVSTANGTLTVNDPDSTAAAFTAQSSSAKSYGTFSITTAGVWSYVLDDTNATVDALTNGQSLTETVTVSTAEGVTATLLITINGVTDAGTTNSAGNDLLSGTGGADTISFDLGGSDTVNGASGNDTLDAGSSLDASDAINGGNDVDTLRLNGSTTVTLGATTVVNIENIVVLAGANYSITAANETHGFTGTLTVDGSALAASNTLTFNASAEAVSGSAYALTGGAGNDSLTGGAGNDVLVGNGGDDVLAGGAGSDTIAGGAGNDSCSLGTGSDVLQISFGTADGMDTVTSFTAGSGGGFDVIDLTGVSDVLIAANSNEGVFSAQTVTANFTLASGFTALSSDLQVTSPTAANLASYLQDAVSGTAGNQKVTVGNKDDIVYIAVSCIDVDSSTSGNQAGTLLARVTGGSNTQIDAADITILAVLVGVTASSLNTSNFSDF